MLVNILYSNMLLRTQLETGLLREHFLRLRFSNLSSNYCCSGLLVTYMSLIFDPALHREGSQVLACAHKAELCVFDDTLLHPYGTSNNLK
jgi:hypothetical protein